MHPIYLMEVTMEIQHFDGIRLDSFIQSLAMGEPESYGGLYIIPILLTEAKSHPYQILEEVIATGAFQVTEVDNHGSVPELRVVNKSDFDVLILDPPRPGLTAEVAKRVVESLPDKIVYLSCNPSTLARDLRKFKDTYDITSVQMIDFFPHTFHIEAVVMMQVR